MLSVGVLLTLAAAASATPTAHTQAVCDYLYAKYPRNIAYDPLGTSALKTTGNASTYNDINTVYWNNQNSNQYRAACAFFPSTAQQVSDAIKQLNLYTDAPFAFKSGGHQPAPGWSAVKDGVLISFEPNLASTVRTANGTHFKVGPGARWGDVYNVTGKTNQIVVGGRLAHIGAGGLTLGGGLSYYSAQYGLACDNVDNFEVVLANGTIANANRTSNADLWWALRGGGGSAQFAIVTNMLLQAHPAGVKGQIWGGLRAYTIDKREAIFRAVTNFVRDYPDAKAALIPVFQFGLPGNLLNAITGPLLFMFYDGPTPPAGVFDEINNITSISDTTATKSYYAMSQEAGGAAIVGFGNSFRNVMYPNLPEDDMVNFLGVYWNETYKQTFVNGLQDLDVQITGFDPQPVSVKIAEASQRQGGNALGLDPNHGDRIWIENNLLWTNPLCNDECPKQSEDLSNRMLDYQKSTYAGVPPTNYKSGDVQWVNYNPLFMNDAAPNQDVFTSYGPTNVAKLKAVKAKYDPNGFLTRLNGFKLPA